MGGECHYSNAPSATATNMEDAGVAAFGAALAAKTGFAVSFSAAVDGRLRTIGDEALPLLT